MCIMRQNECHASEWSTNNVSVQHRQSLGEWLHENNSTSVSRGVRRTVLVAETSSTANVGAMVKYGSHSNA